MMNETVDDAVEVPDVPVDETESPEGHLVPEGEESTVRDDTVDEGSDSFPRAYVEKLRAESAEYRVKAKRVDELGARLQTALVAADGRLADPTDLPYDPALLEDEDALGAAVADLLAVKPHLASRRPVGAVGQGARPSSESVSLLGLMRDRA